MNKKKHSTRRKRGVKGGKSRRCRKPCPKNLSRKFQNIDQALEYYIYIIFYFYKYKYDYAVKTHALKKTLFQNFK